MNSSKIELCPKMTMSHNRDPSYFDFNTGIIVCAMNGVLSVPTTILNLLLILSILTSPNLRRPSYILICALAFTDLGVGILVQPLYIARKITFMMSDYETYCILMKTGNVVAHVICSPSFFIVTAISVDRYLAIYLRASYQQHVTNRAVLQYLAFTIVCACCITVSRFHATSPKYMGFGAFFLCVFLFIILFCYFKSLSELSQLQAKSSARSSQPVASHRRVLATLMMIVTALFMCYVPFVVVVIAIAIIGRSKPFMIAWEITASMMYFNSFLNPILHFSRLKELRESCWAVIKKSNRSIDERNQANLGYDNQALEKQLAELSLDTGQEVLDHRDLKVQFSNSESFEKAQELNFPEPPSSSPSKPQPSDTKVKEPVCS
ncbi:adrenocorticotropic hormone receptor isoform X2 [Exaiptasia diaphana]|uniref:G-protein coupled receptors family 1 profile domain-containing protein n=1 Tax=Exaiptasia diaphana TaxID=2652724 RepID=A0A913YF44_EXADI|nr:adrenocorticotropic hormone receptor isoform X2 [Exaiptasia diaphana]